MSGDRKVTQAPQSVLSSGCVCVRECVCRCARACRPPPRAYCMCSVIGWLGGGRPIRLSGVIVALRNRGPGVSAHSVISQIRVIHLLCVSVRAPAAPLIAALIHFPSITLTLFSSPIPPSLPPLSLVRPHACTVQMLCLILI